MLNPLEIDIAVAPRSWLTIDCCIWKFIGVHHIYCLVTMASCQEPAEMREKAYHELDREDFVVGVQAHS